MKYYLKEPEHQAISGPFEFDEIEAKFRAGALPAGTLATRDIGEGLPLIQHAPPEDWMPTESIFGLGVKGPPSSIVLQPPPVPLSLHQVVSAPPSRPGGMAFCSACGHRLAPDAVSVCDRCGKKLVIVRQEPARPLENKPKSHPPEVEVDVAKAAVAAGGGCLSVVVVILMVLGVLFLFGFLMFLNLMSTCKAWKPGLPSVSPFWPRSGCRLPMPVFGMALNRAFNW